MGKRNKRAKARKDDPKQQLLGKPVVAPNSVADRLQQEAEDLGVVKKARRRLKRRF